MGADAFGHQLLDEVLTGAVRQPRPGTSDRTWVHWDTVASRMKTLDAYLAAVAAAHVAAHTEDERAAFFTNAYNALVMRAFLANGRKRVIDVKGFFDAQRFTVAGERLTLNELEERKLRRLDASGRSRDPRVHFVVNCASRDCPPLAPRAYAGSTWSAELDVRTRAFLQRPGEVEVDVRGHRIVVVQLFEWYAADFGGEDGVRRFIGAHRPDLRASILDDQTWDLDFRPYDWSPNDRP